MAVAGAIVGEAAGGYVNDLFGRQRAIFAADLLFFGGAIVMAAAPSPGVIIVGCLLVGFGVGMASLTSPLYIFESSPARIRGALVSTNGFLITGGQFLTSLTSLSPRSFSLSLSLSFSLSLFLSLSLTWWGPHSHPQSDVVYWCAPQTPGTWRWMLGIAGVPALLQFVLMMFLPKSPRWLYRMVPLRSSEQPTNRSTKPLSRFYRVDLVHQGRDQETETILRRIYLPREAEREIEDLQESIQMEIRAQGSTEKVNRFKLWKMAAVRRGLVAGVGLQVFQQFVGINTVMYYSLTIIQMAGFASNQTALLLSKNLGKPHLSVSSLSAGGAS